LLAVVDTPHLQPAVEAVLDDVPSELAGRADDAHFAHGHCATSGWEALGLRREAGESGPGGTSASFLLFPSFRLVDAKRRIYLLYTEDLGFFLVFFFFFFLITYSGFQLGVRTNT
jgi:hypothetical protein